jgi:hypothetical protein
MQHPLELEYLACQHIESCLAEAARRRLVCQAIRTQREQVQQETRIGLCRVHDGMRRLTNCFLTLSIGIRYARIFVAHMDRLAGRCPR